MFDTNDRRRLYKEAKEYLSLRAKRKQFVKDQKKETAGVLSGAEERAS